MFHLLLKHCKLCAEKRYSKTYAVWHKTCKSNGPNDLLDLIYLILLMQWSILTILEGKLIMCRLVNHFTKKLYGYLLENKSSKETTNILKNLLNNDGIDISTNVSKLTFFNSFYRSDNTSNRNLRTWSNSFTKHFQRNIIPQYCLF